MAKGMAGGAITVNSLLRRLFNMSHHPDPYQRLGAASAFNQMYRSFREETALVDKHVLEMLHHAVVSLRLSHRDAAAVGTTEAAELVVDHLQRIVEERGDNMIVLAEAPTVAAAALLTVAVAVAAEVEKKE